VKGKNVKTKQLADVVEDASITQSPDHPIASTAAPPAWLLKLDADGVYWGATEISPADVNADDVVLDHMPDNRPGIYKWNAIEARLDPLPKAQQKDVQVAPDLERAFDELCTALAKQNVGLSPLVVEWQAWYRRTVDNKKTIDG